MGGVLIFSGFKEFDHRVSMAQAGLGGKAGVVLENVVERGADIMREVILSGGVNKTKKGGARVDSGDMLASVGHEANVSRGRARGTFGFINNAPFYTLFQEKGTGANGPARAKGSGGFDGIASMLAYATAVEKADTYLQNRMHNVDWLAANSSKLK